MTPEQRDEILRIVGGSKPAEKSKATRAPRSKRMIKIGKNTILMYVIGKQIRVTCLEEPEIPLMVPHDAEFKGAKKAARVLVTYLKALKEFNQYSLNKT